MTMNQVTSDPLPPSYETVLSDNKKPLIELDQPQQPQQPAQQATMQAGPSHAVPVYFYQDPITGNRVTTFLPPDHPEMVCLMNGHISKTRFGLLGVLAAIFWFPLGVGLCLVDRHVKCTRCNRILEDGITCG